MRSFSRLALLAAVFWFAGVPVVALFFGAVHGRSGFTGRYLEKVFLSGAYLRPFLSTIELAAYAGLLATVLGVALAAIMARIRLPARAALEIGIMTPLFMSPFIGAIGWITLAEPRSGMLNAVIGALGLPRVDVFTYTGTAVTMALYFAPYGYALVRHAVDRLNPEMEEAAAISGAGRLATARGVTVPLLWPSVVSALIFTFILAAEMFSIPGILLVPKGYEFLSYSIFVRTTRWPLDHSEAAAAGVLLLLLTVAGIGLYAWVVRIQERFIAVGPRAPRAQAPPRSVLVRALGLGAVLGYIAASVALPAAAIAVRSLLPYFTGELALGAFSLDNIRRTLSDQLVRDSLVNSVLVTTMSTAALVVLAFLVALGRTRHRDFVASLTATVASIPVAVPGVLFGVGLLWTYIRTPVYATLGIIVLVMLARFLPILVRMFETALIQIGRELEEAAAVCGATDATISLRIRLPLLLGTLRSAITVGGAQVFNELTASALLFTSSSSVLPVVVFNYMFDGDYSRAAAVALLQMVMLIAGFAVISATISALARRAGGHVTR